MVRIAWLPTVALLAAAALAAEPAGPVPAPAVPFATACFSDFDDAAEYPTPEQLRALLVPVGRATANVTATTKSVRGRQRTLTYVDGLFRLKVDWQPGTTLRLSLLDAQLVQLHFWHGTGGVSLRYCPPAAQSWGAYGVTRSGDGPRPDTWAIWGLDNGRYRRVGLGTVEVRHEAGRLLLTRGDCLLLSAPMPAPPTEVYFEGAGLVRGLATYISQGGPALPPANPTVLNLPRPAAADWLVRPEKARFEKSPIGAVELAAGDDAETATATVALAESGLYEYLFELDAPQVGSGIFVADDQGRCLTRLSFFRDRNSGRTTFAWLPAQRDDTELSFDFDRAIVPFAGPRQWLRLTVGGGVAKCWTSGDGVDWRQAIWAPSAVQGAVSRVGIFCLPGEPQRRVRLRSIEVRRLAALAELAPTDFVRRAPRLADAADLAAWQRRVDRARPSDVPAAAWQRACALRTLAENPYFSLGGRLLADLLDGALAEPRDAAEQQAILEQAAILVHNLDVESVRPLDAQYVRFGLDLQRAGNPDALAITARAILATPLWNFDRQNAWPEPLLRHDLLAAAMADRRPELQRLVERLRFWQRPDLLDNHRPPWDVPTEHLVTWAEHEVAPQALPDDEASPAMSPWRPALLPQLDREDFNVVGELRGAIEAKAYREACETITAAARPDSGGLTPDQQDPRLLVGLSEAITLTMGREPVLRQTMREQFAELGQLRLKQAMAAGDGTAAAAVAVQFCGTPAAAAACQWLGDRALSSGRPSVAAELYRRAASESPPIAGEPLAPQARLAAALAGQPTAAAAAGTVRVGSWELSGPAFARLLGDLRTRADAAGRAVARDGEVLDPSTRPAACEVRPWSRGATVNVPRPPGVPDSPFDWGAGQATVQVTADRLLIADPLELTSIELHEKQRGWTHRLTPDRDAAPTGTTIRPLTDGERVFLACPTTEGMVLRCLDAATGRLRWTSAAVRPAMFEPLRIEHTIGALSLQNQAGRKLTLALDRFDPESGVLVGRSPLVEFREPELWRFECRAAVCGDRVVASLFGCVVCCDDHGRPHWVRQQIYVPPPPSPYADQTLWLGQRHGPPLICEGRVYVTQPGVWAVECLDFATGALLWRHAMPEIVGLVGGDADRLLIETTDGLRALATDTGRELWHWDAPGRVAATAVWGHDGVAAATLPAATVGRSVAMPELSIVDARTGRLRQSATLRMKRPRPENVRLGPLCGIGGRLWTFVAEAADPGRREAWEIVPAASAER